jgi:hypothetical protein
LFELGVPPASSDASRQALTGVPAGSARAGVAVRDTPLPRRSASRQTPKKRAYPIELTAVSAIVLDLLSGFQRPSDRSPNRHRSDGGPTLLRSASEAVKHPLWAGTPVVSRTYVSIHELFWRPRRGASPPLIRGWFVRGVGVHIAAPRPCQPWVRRR